MPTKEENMKYYKYHNPRTGEVKEFTRKKGITLQTQWKLKDEGFNLITKMEITFDPNFIKFLENRG